MAEYSITNGQLSIIVLSMGAELVSLKACKTGQEYMWEGNPDFWGRTSPVLFPFVGSLRNKEFQCEGQTYAMSQHGFARDMEFKLTEETSSSLWLAVESDAKTLEQYPFAFRLEIGYELKDKSVLVKWKVTNLDKKEMYFSIGGHPGFVCPLNPAKDMTDYSIQFDTKDKVVSTVIGKSGLASAEQEIYTLEKGILPITAKLFDRDALVIEDHQASKVSFLDENKKAYLTVSFDAPLFGIWSPPKKNAPFICIEPWYGRCDSESFTGELKDREWGNVLPAGAVFESGYQVEIPAE